MANILSQDEIDFLLNANSKGQLDEAAGTKEAKPAKKPASATLDQSELDALFGNAQASAPPEPIAKPPAPVKVEETLPWVPKTIRGKSMRDYRIPQTSVMFADQVRQLESAQVVVERLIKLSSKFRKAGRGSEVRELGRFQNVYGHTVGLCILPNKLKPVRLKMYQVPILTRHRKFIQSEHQVDWTSKDVESEHFQYKWARWFEKNFDPPTLQQMAHIA